VLVKQALALTKTKKKKKTSNVKETDSVEEALTSEETETIEKFQIVKEEEEEVSLTDLPSLASSLLASKRKRAADEQGPRKALKVEEQASTDDMLSLNDFLQSSKKNTPAPFDIDVLLGFKRQTIDSPSSLDKKDAEQEDEQSLWDEAPGAPEALKKVGAEGALDYDLSDLDELEAGWSVMSEDSQQRKAAKAEKQMNIDKVLGLVDLRPSPSSKRKRGAEDQASNKAQKVVEEEEDVKEDVH
jgi:hypothetical protein